MNYIIIFIVIAIIVALGYYTMKSEKNTAALGGNNTIILMDPDGNFVFTPLADVKNAIDSKQAVGDYATNSALTNYATKESLTPYATKADYVSNSALIASNNAADSKYATKAYLDATKSSLDATNISTKAALDANTLATKTSEDFFKTSQMLIKASLDAEIAKAAAAAAAAETKYATKASQDSAIKALKDYATVAYQKAGNYQPVGDYATNAGVLQADRDINSRITATNASLAGYQRAGNYQPVGDYATNQRVNDVNNTLLGKIDSTWNHASNAQNEARAAQARANDAHSRIDQTWYHASNAHNRIDETNNNLNNYVKYNDELGISSKDSKSGGEGERWIGRWGDTIKTLDPNGRDTLISSATRFKISKNPPS